MEQGTPDATGESKRAPDQTTRASPKAVAALTFGIVGIAIVWVPFIQWISVVFGVLALVLGFLGRAEIRRSAGTLAGPGMAVAGVALGVLQLVFMLVVVADLLRGIEAGAIAALT